MNRKLLEDDNVKKFYKERYMPLFNQVLASKKPGASMYKLSGNFVHDIIDQKVQELIKTEYKKHVRKERLEDIAASIPLMTIAFVLLYAIVSAQ